MTAMAKACLDRTPCNIYKAITWLPIIMQTPFPLHLKLSLQSLHWPEFHWLQGRPFWIHCSVVIGNCPLCHGVGLFIFCFGCLFVASSIMAGHVLAPRGDWYSTNDCTNDSMYNWCLNMFHCLYSRYNYFPLAYAAPGIARCLDCFFENQLILEERTQKAITQKQSRRSCSLKCILRSLLVLTAITGYLAFLSVESTSLLLSFRNDKHLLLRCIRWKKNTQQSYFVLLFYAYDYYSIQLFRMDPTDSDCHEFLGNYYGSQGNQQILVRWIN